MTLNTQPNFSGPDRRSRHAYTPGDDFYNALIQAHHGLTDAQSDLLNARLLLLLANHIGELDVLYDAIEVARRAIVAPAASAD